MGMDQLAQHPGTAQPVSAACVPESSTSAPLTESPLSLTDVLDLIGTPATIPTMCAKPTAPGSIPDLPDFATTADMLAYIGVDASAPNTDHRFDTDPAVWSPDQAAHVLARTGTNSATFVAAWHAVLYRINHDRASLEALNDAIESSDLWFNDDTDGIPEPPTTANIDYTSKLYRIAVLLCAILTQRARDDVYSTAWRMSALVALIVKAIAELWELTHDTQLADDEPQRADLIDRLPPPPILEALTTAVLTSAPPVLATTGAECSPCA